MKSKVPKAVRAPARLRYREILDTLDYLRAQKTQPGNQSIIEIANAFERCILGLDAPSDLYARIQVEVTNG